MVLIKICFHDSLLTVFLFKSSRPFQGDSSVVVSDCSFFMSVLVMSNTPCVCTDYIAQLRVATFWERAAPSVNHMFCLYYVSDSLTCNHPYYNKSTNLLLYSQNQNECQ